MSVVHLTCDRLDNLMRVAVWREGKLCDLYLDRIDNPDLTGALVRGKAVRVTAGGKAAWYDAGLSKKIYVEETKGILRAGEIKSLCIRTTRSQGKASNGLIVEDHKGIETIGLIEHPPQPWQKALYDLKGEKVLCFFSTREDWLACEKFLGEKSKAKLAPFSKEKINLDLEDVLDTLLQRRVSLMGGGQIVIDQTEALVAIDVDAGEVSNAVSVNLAAMHEIARQIRLRNLSGIIILDALKMKERADKAKVLGALTRACEKDPLKPDIFGFTKLGLIEMTRPRRGLSLNEICEK